MSSQSKQQAHQAAKRQNACEVLTRGEQKLIVVWKPPKEISGGKALTKIEGIKTFVHPGPHNLSYGDTVGIKILDVGENHAEAVAISVL
jgi:hypothetical protein